MWDHNQLFAFFRALIPSAVVKAGTDLQCLKDNKGMCVIQWGLGWRAVLISGYISACERSSGYCSLMEKSRTHVILPNTAHCVSMVTNIEFIMTFNMLFCTLSYLPIHDATVKD